MSCQKTEVLFLNQFCFLGDFDVDRESIKDVEFSFHPVHPGFTCYYHNRNLRGETLEIKERPVLNVKDIGEPNRETYYCFSGEIMPEMFLDQKELVMNHHIFHGLKYDRYENDMHYFKMPEKHPGHKWFEGCSGAPIIGEDGKVVSLVSGGCENNNEIYGNNLSKCIRTLDCYFE